MAQLFTNNATSLLASSFSAVATSLVVTTGHGARFPNPTGGDYFLLTLIGVDGNGNENAWEIVKVTARSTDTMTVTRAQEGTTAVLWAASTRVELRSTAGTLGGLAPAASPVFTGVAKFSNAAVEAKTAIAASAIDLATGNFFTKTISGATTFTVSNVPTTGTVASFVLDLTNGGSATVTWWSGVKWAGGTAPTLTSAGRDVLGFFTHDAGTTWTGLVLGKDVK